MNETAPYHWDEYYTGLAAGVASEGEDHLRNRNFIAFEDGYLDKFSNSFIVPGGNGVSVYDTPGGELIFCLYIQP